MIRKLILNKYPKLSLVIRLGENGSRFVNDKLDIFMPTITEFNSKILKEHPVLNKNNREDVFTIAFITKYMELSQASNFYFIN